MRTANLERGEMFKEFLNSLLREVELVFELVLVRTLQVLAGVVDGCPRGTSTKHRPQSFLR